LKDLLIFDKVIDVQSVSSGRRVIHFENRKAEVEGFYMLLRAKMPIYSAGPDKYLITEQQCRLLSDNHIEYKVDKHL
jgi:hypothetical protein